MTTSKRSNEASSDGLTTEQPDFAVQQARAYGDLLPVYEARHELLQPSRHVVLNRVLDGLETGLSVLEVGCGCGASLELMAQRGFKAEGIDLSPDMVLAAHTRSGCPVTCVDFRNHAFERHYDLVFAQAFVHLFPKTAAGDVIDKLQALALRRLYFSTSVAECPSEGWEKKDGVLRYRSRYTASEVRDLIARTTSREAWRAQTFELVDPLGKHWINVILDRELVDESQ